MAVPRKMSGPTHLKPARPSRLKGSGRFFRRGAVCYRREPRKVCLAARDARKRGWRLSSDFGSKGKGRCTDVVWEEEESAGCVDFVNL